MTALALLISLLGLMLFLYSIVTEFIGGTILGFIMVFVSIYLLRIAPESKVLDGGK